MKRAFLPVTWTSLYFFILLCLMLVGPEKTWARRTSFGSDSDGSRARQQYNPQTVTTVKGLVESLGSYGQTGWRVAPGMQIQGLVLKTDKGDVTVNLGPPTYVSQQGFSLAKGDNLEVTGSQVTRDDQPVLLAAQVKKEGRTLKLRDEKGAPLWPEQDRGGRSQGGMGSGGRGRGFRNW